MSGLAILSFHRQSIAGFVPEEPMATVPTVLRAETINAERIGSRMGFTAYPPSFYPYNTLEFLGAGNPVSVVPWAGWFP